MSSNLVLVISENRQIGSEVLLCLDSAGFEGCQCSFSQASFDIEKSHPVLAIFDDELVNNGPCDGLDSSLFTLLSSRKISLLLMADSARDTTILQQASGAKEVIRTNNLGPALFKWLTTNQKMLLTDLPTADPFPDVDTSLPNRVGPPPKPGSPIAQPSSPMRLPVAPPPRPGSSMAQPPSPMGLPVAPPPRPDSSIIADTFSPVRKPLARENIHKPVTVAAKALESKKKPLPPVVSSKLLVVPEETKELPLTIDIDPVGHESDDYQQHASYRHILLIDKNPLVQHSLRELAYTGLAYEWASNITDGAILLKDEQPAAVFIQESLEELTGLQACSYIKSIPTYKDLPIFIITEANTSLTEEEINQGGANGSIQEPFSSEYLIRFLASNNLMISLTGENHSQNMDNGPVSLSLSTSKKERAGVRTKNKGRRKPLKNEAPPVGEPDLTLPDIDMPEIDMPEIEMPDIGIPEIDVPEIDIPEIDIPDILDEPLELPEFGSKTRNSSSSASDDKLTDIDFPHLDT